MARTGSKGASEGPRRLTISLIVIAIAAALTALGFYWVQFWGQALSQSTQVWGTFGDYVGGLLGPTMAFLALVALVTAVNLQWREFHTAAQAMERQAEDLHTQRFESAVFSALEMYRALCADFPHQPPQTPLAALRQNFLDQMVAAVAKRTEGTRIEKFEKASKDYFQQVPEAERLCLVIQAILALVTRERASDSAVFLDDVIKGTLTETEVCVFMAFVAARDTHELTELAKQRRVFDMLDETREKTPLRHVAGSTEWLKRFRGDYVTQT